MITLDELSTAVYREDLTQITDGDDAAPLQAIAAAEEEVRAYLTAYDTAVIFAAEGTDRNPLLMEHIKTIAIWHLIKLCNADLIYEHWRERYDRAIAFLEKVQRGAVSLALPLRLSGSEAAPIQMVSNTKFKHYY